MEFLQGIWEYIGKPEGGTFAVETISEFWPSFWRYLWIAMVIGFASGILAFIVGKISKLLGVIVQYGPVLFFMWQVYSLREQHVFYLVCIIISILGLVIALIQAVKNK